MEQQQVTARIAAQIPDADVAVQGEGCSFTVRVVAASFAGMRPVARQQRVMDGFIDVLQSGEMHALSIQAFTPEEWARSQQPVTLQL